MRNKDLSMLGAAIALSGLAGHSNKGQWNTGPQHTPVKKAKKKAKRKLAHATG